MLAEGLTVFGAGPLAAVLLELFQMLSPGPVKQILVTSSLQPSSRMSQIWLPVDSPRLTQQSKNARNMT